MNTRPPIALALVALLCSIAAQAAPLSVEHRAALAATLEDPADLDKAVRFIEVALSEADYEGAITTLERMLLLSPDLPAVRVRLGGLYLRLGAQAQARVHADAALASPTATEGTRAEAAALIAHIARRSGRHRLSGGVTAALGFASNANSAPSAESISVGGSTYALSAEDRAQADGNGFVSAGLGYAYDPDLESGLTLEAALGGSFSKQIEVTDYDIAALSLAVGPRLPLSDDPLSGAALWGYAVANGSTLGGDLYATGVGGGVSLTVPITRRLWTDVLLEVSHVTYHDGDVAPSASDQSGLAPRAAAQLRVGVLRSLWLIAGGRAGTERTEDDSLTNVAYGGLAGLSIPLASPFSGGAWTTDVVYELTRTAYKAADPDVAPDTARNDTEHRITALTQMSLGDHLSVFLSGGYARHGANLELYRWSGAFASSGASYTF